MKLIRTKLVALISLAFILVTTSLAFAGEEKLSCNNLNLSTAQNLFLNCKGEKKGSAVVKFIQGKATYNSKVQFSKTGTASFDLRSLFSKQFNKKGIKGDLFLTGKGIKCTAVSKNGKKNENVSVQKVLGEEDETPAVTPTPTSTPTPVTSSTSSASVSSEPSVSSAVSSFSSVSSSSSSASSESSISSSSSSSSFSSSAISSSASSALSSSSTSSAAVSSATSSTASTSSPVVSSSSSSASVAQGRSCEVEATDLTANVQKTVISETSNLNRATRRITNTAVVSIKNISQEALLAPSTARVTVHFPAPANAGAVTLNGASMSGTPPGDLTASIDLGPLAPNASVQKTLVFENASTVRISWDLAVFAKCPSTSSSSSSSASSQGEVHPPVVFLQNRVFQVNEGGSLEFPVSASDPDGDKVSLTFDSVSAGIPNSTFIVDGQSSGNLNPQGTFKVLPKTGDAGFYQLAFRATDPLGLTDVQTATLEVIKVNLAPQLQVQPSATVREGQPLVVPVKATDPDGDEVEVTAENLPPNAIFLPGNENLLFTPDLNQAGNYSVQFQATDGQLNSPLKTVSIEVQDATSGGGGPVPLNLIVDKPASPTLITKSRITGVVNQEAGTGPVNQPVGALVVGLSPTGLRQGVSGVIEVTGQVGGQFPTHFRAGETEFSFGDGVTVTSVEIVSESFAKINVTVSPLADVGIRAPFAKTGEELAQSLLSFNVLPGQSSVKGKIVDPETGNPIPGARVSIQGSNQFVLTGADGSFVLPTSIVGDQRLFVTAPNREPISIAVSLTANSEIEIGSLETKRTVFDPLAPPGATLGSILGRGAADSTGNVSIEDAKKVIIDTILTVGGNESGVLDDYGNQLNPKVTEGGLISLTPPTLDAIAQMMATGENMTLGELLWSFAFAHRWTAGRPPTLLEMLTKLQQQIDQAWLNPQEPTSAIVIALFNPGRSLAPDAPKISAATVLNPLQQYLLAGSFFSYSVLVLEANPSITPVGPIAGLDEKAKIWNVISDALVEKAYAQSTAEPPTNVDYWTTYWNNQWSTTNMPAGVVVGGAVDIIKATVVPKAQNYLKTLCNASTVTPAAASTINLVKPGKWSYLTKEIEIPGKFGGIATGAVNVGVSAISGLARTLLINWITEMTIEVLRPAKPLVTKKEVLELPEPLKQFFPDYKTVRIEFTKTYGDKGAKNPPGEKFVYRLWRRETPDGELKFAGGGVPDYIAAQSGENSGPVFVDPTNGRLSIVDFFPHQGKHNLYQLDVIRNIGNQGGADGSGNIGSGYDWYFGFLVGPTLSAGRASFSPASALMAITDPLLQIANALRSMSSPLTDPFGLFVGNFSDLGDQADGIVVDPVRRLIYESVPATGSIYTIHPDTFTRSFFTDAGFKPYQAGLAIDRSGSLYSENVGTNDSWGGKIFKYTSNNPLFASDRIVTREHVGMTNYFSHLLGYARPTSVIAMAMYIDNELLVLDGVEQRIKKVPTNKTYDPFRRVGQPWAESPEFNFAPGNDIAVNSAGQVVVTTNNKILEISGGGTLIRPIMPNTPGLTSPKGITYDLNNNLYVADSGDGSNGSIILVPDIVRQQDFTLTECQLDALRFVRDVPSLGTVRVDPDMRGLIYRSKGNTFRVGFGLSGRVVDKDNQPVVGAEVIAQAWNGTPQPPVRTDQCGVFHITNLQNTYNGTVGSLTIKHRTVGTENYTAYLEFHGQTRRDFVLDPPPLPPLPSPTPTSTATATPTPTPTPTSTPKAVLKGKINKNDIPRKPTAPLPTGTPLPQPTAKPDEISVTAPRLEIVSPPNGAVLDSTSVRLEGTISDDGATNGRLFINGAEQPIAFSNGRFDVTVTVPEGGVTFVVTAQGDVDGTNPVQTLTGTSPGVSIDVVPAGTASSGAIVGKVTDEVNGSPIQGIQVVIKETGEETTTNLSGEYGFPAVTQDQATVVLGEAIELE